MDKSEEQLILEGEMDKTVIHKNFINRKPRSVLYYEYSLDGYNNSSFGISILNSILKGFASVFDYEGFPNDFDTSMFETFLNQSGRIKIIKVGSKFIPVHVVPKMYDNYGNWIETTIIEPYLPKLSGLKTEIFPNIEFKNDVLGKSIPSLIYVFISELDEIMDAISINKNVITGKFAWVKNNGNLKKGDNSEESISFSNELVNSQPGMIIHTDITSGSEFPIQLLQAQDVTSSLISNVRFIISQIFNVLGIPNDDQGDKKERKITDEINIQNIMQATILEDMFKQRKIAIEKFNKLFNMNVKVKMKDIIKQEIEPTEDDNVLQTKEQEE